MADEKPVGSEEGVEIIRAEDCDAFDIFQWLGQSFFADHYLFEEMSSVAPPRDGVGDGINDLLFAGDEPCLHKGGVQVIEDEDAVWPEGGADHADGIVIFAPGFEVAE